MKGEPLAYLPGHSVKRPAAPAASKPGYKVCIRCRLEKPVDEFPRDGKRVYPYCLLCKGGYMRESRRRNADVARRREHLSRLPRKYGISAEDYERMLEAQGGRCAICQRTAVETGRRLAVDHDHTTGVVRGLLCAADNRAIGLLGDDPERALRVAAYLERRS